MYQITNDKKMNLEDIFPLILKDGLREAKFKNSHLKIVPSAEEGKRGAIFAFRSKSRMTRAYGVVLSSLEAVFENQDNFTHWTPNVYRYGSYTDKRKHITRGHSEDNLKQINTFYIDFDNPPAGESINSGDILTASIDLGFMPTMILRTDKGYQAYFVLNKPVYITSKSQFRAIKVAKVISQNLREYFKQTLPVDLTCNHFGIARIPRTNNVEFFHEEYIYSFQEWLEWSMKQSDIPFLKKKPNLSVVSGTEGIKQIDEPWYRLLMNNTKIQGTKDVMGRNSILFTLALANFSSGISQEKCEEVLSIFNCGLDEPLSSNEFLKTIKSAYSGKYEAANRDYVVLLCRAWVNQNLSSKELFLRQRWYKFKKNRKDRKYSHFKEWQLDIIKYLHSHTDQENLVLKTTQKVLGEELGISSSSLKIVLKQLSRSNKVFLQVKKGRNGGLLIASVKSVFLSIIQKKKMDRDAYITTLTLIFKKSKYKILKSMKEIEDKLKTPFELHLFERDVGLKGNKF